MSEWLKLTIAFLLGGWFSLFRANTHYRKEITKEALKLRITEIQLKREKLNAEIDRVLDRRAGRGE
jgi:hypothetical protein